MLMPGGKQEGAHLWWSFPCAGQLELRSLHVNPRPIDQTTFRGLSSFISHTG